MIKELNLYLQKHLRIRTKVNRAPASIKKKIMVSRAPKISIKENIDFEKPGRTFSETVLSIIDEKGYKDADVYKKAGISKQVFSNLRSNRNYEPSRNTAFALGFALELDLPEMTSLLTAAGIRFSSSRQFDLIVKYFFLKKIYDLKYINETLYEYTGKCLLD